MFWSMQTIEENQENMNSLEKAKKQLFHVFSDNQEFMGFLVFSNALGPLAMKTIAKTKKTH